MLACERSCLSVSPGFTLPKPTVSPETWPFMRMKEVISAETPSFEGLGLGGVRNPWFRGGGPNEKGGAERRLPDPPIQRHNTKKTRSHSVTGSLLWCAPRDSNP